jgi:hypothetical protein
MDNTLQWLLKAILGNMGTIALLVTLVLNLKVAINARKFLIEVHELIGVYIKASADGKLTPEEIRAIIKEAKDIPNALKIMLRLKR